MLTPLPRVHPVRSYFLSKIAIRRHHRCQASGIVLRCLYANPWYHLRLLGIAHCRLAAPPTLHLTSTVAPASVNFFLMFSASSLEIPSLMGLGALSTKSLASFKPKLVTSRTALITLILLAPTSFSTTLNSVFSSAGAAPAAAPAPPPAIMTGAAAAAETPSRSSSFLTSCAASSSDNPTIESSNCCRSAILSLHFFELSVAYFVIGHQVSSATRLSILCAR